MNRALFVAILSASIAFPCASFAQDLDAVFPNGDHFVGSFNGSGVYTYASGSRYEGAMVNGASSGAGSLTLTWGDQYDGAFLNGVASGEGVYVFNDSVRFDGTFAAWVPEGSGALTLADGTRFEGTWSAGAAVSVTRVSGAGDLPSVTPCYFGLC